MRIACKCKIRDCKGKMSVESIRCCSNPFRSRNFNGKANLSAEVRSSMLAV